MLKMFSMGFNARFYTSHHGPPHPFKLVEAVAVSLTGIHNAMCLSVVNRICIHNGLVVGWLILRQSMSRQIRLGVGDPYEAHGQIYFSILENYFLLFP
jgi:hypothetical protein